MSRLCATLRERPGELLHVDTKRLNRGLAGRQADPRRRQEAAAPGQAGSSSTIAIDDHTRLAYAEVLPAEDGKICAAFLTRALAWYREQGIRVERVLTDNAGAYRSRVVPGAPSAPATSYADGFTRPYRPQTNGKAEALIKTLTRERAYRFAYRNEHTPRQSPAQLPPLV